MEPVPLNQYALSHHRSVIGSLWHPQRRRLCRDKDEPSNLASLDAPSPFTSLVPTSPSNGPKVGDQHDAYGNKPYGTISHSCYRKARKVCGRQKLRGKRIFRHS